MNKHTPGPWVVIDRGAPFDPEMKIVNPNLARFWVGATRCGHVDGEVAPISSECAITCAPHLDSEANARLIAAAPEMLEALCGFVRQFESGVLPSLACEKAKEAIAKAEGRGK